MYQSGGKFERFTFQIAKRDLFGEALAVMCK